jgi:hypothetical protein
MINSNSPFVTSSRLAVNMNANQVAIPSFALPSLLVAFNIYDLPGIYDSNKLCSQILANLSSLPDFYVDSHHFALIQNLSSNPQCS